MKQSEEHCEIVGDFRHETEELFPDYDDAIIGLWRALPTKTLERTYVHQGCSISLKFNWDSLIQMLIKRRESIRKFKESPESAPDNWWEIFFEKVTCGCEASILGANDLSKHGWYAAFFVESHLYDLFLILNIALPGSGNFHNVRVSSADEKFHQDLDLSSFYFEDAWLSAHKDIWPPLDELPLESVSEWFCKVRPGFNQVPEGPIERSLFALLHICRSDGRPEDIIWLFYAMESLFETKPGENFSALYDRLCLILDPPNETGVRLKKELRKLYDYRSSFVHGGLPIIHPHHHEIMDRRVDKQYDEIVTLSLRWTHILVACLQRFAKEGWTEVKFQTKLVTF